MNEFVSRSIARRAAIPSKSRQPDGPECGALGLHAPVCPLRIGTRYSCDREPSFPQARVTAIRPDQDVRLAFGYHLQDIACLLCLGTRAQDLYISSQYPVGSFLAQRAPPAEVSLLCSLCSHPVISLPLLASQPILYAMRQPPKRLSTRRSVTLHLSIFEGRWSVQCCMVQRS